MQSSRNQIRCAAALAVLFLFAFATQAWAQASDTGKHATNPIEHFSNVAKAYGVDTDTIGGLTFEFRATENQFGHLSRPWETRQRELAGEFWFGNKAFFSRETITRRTTIQHREIAYANDKLYRTIDSRPSKLTREDGQHFLRESCRYTPALLLRHIMECLSSENGAIQNRIKITQSGQRLIVIGSYAGETYEVECSDGTLSSIDWTRHHEMYGDQIISIEYSMLKTVGDLTYASSIKESSYDQVLFDLKVLSANRPDTPPELINQPDDYELEKEQVTKELIEVDKFSDHVTFLHMTHTDSRTTVVEFKDFLMVIDAPTSSRNGQLILDEIDGMNFGKPVKLFAFGHHHPHYLGGVRAFVAAEATILTTKKVTPYLKQLVAFSHTLQRDELQLKPAELVVQEFEDHVTISDGDYEVEIFDIGLDSHHTIDYLLFYFPAEKMLLQGDGVSVRAGSPPSRRTKAVYDAIKRLKLEVTDCIQGWPTQNYGIETKLKFSDLESYIEKFIRE